MTLFKFTIHYHLHGQKNTICKEKENYEIQEFTKSFWNFHSAKIDLLKVAKSSIYDLINNQHKHEQKNIIQYREKKT